MTRIPSLNGRLNFEATWALRQLSRGDAKSALIDLFASDEPLEAETRLAIYEAPIADRDKIDSELKLRVVGPRHRPRTMVSELELIHRRHRVGNTVAKELARPGAVEKQIIEDVATREGLAEGEVRASLKAWTNRKFDLKRIKIK